MKTNKNETVCNYCENEITVVDNEVAACERCKSAALPSVHKFVKGSFVITHDHLEEKSANELATVNRLVELGYSVPFKLYDDDQIRYYSGRLHQECEDEFEPLDWGMADSGCVDIHIRNPKTGRYEVL